MSCYLEPDSHIRDKVKVVLHLLNYATERELDHATDTDTPEKETFYILKKIHF